jgi:hypothetical protein
MIILFPYGITPTLEPTFVNVLHGFWRRSTPSIALLKQKHERQILHSTAINGHDMHSCVPY